MFDFPGSPTEGQLFQPSGGALYKYANGAWTLPSTPPVMNIADTAPVNPIPGQLWWQANTGNAFLWYDDGTSKQWVQFNIGAFAEAPADGNSYTRRNSGWESSLVAAGAASASSFSTSGSIDAGSVVTAPTFRTSAAAAGSGTQNIIVSGSAGQVQITTGGTYGLVVGNAGWTNYTSVGPGTINVTGSGLSFQFGGSTRTTVGTGGNWFFTGASAGYSVDTRASVSPNCPALIAWCANMTNYAILAYYSSPTYYPIYGVGASYMSGAWTSSDGRFKAITRTKDGNDALTNVLAIPVTSYTPRSPVAALMLGLDEGDEGEKFGFLAQDVEKVIPVAVRDIGPPPHDLKVRAFLKGVEVPEEGSDAATALGEEPITFKGLNDQYLLATLWAAVQTLTAKVQALEAARA